MSEIQEFRNFYARFVVGSAGSSNERLVSAFAAVERERFVGPGPWQVYTEAGYLTTISDDPRLLYQDILVGLATDRGINNGQPSLHARLLAAAEPKPGESVVHVGSGTGYYTAALAELVGPTGSVDAYEIEKDLADRASANLSSWSNVRVHCASAADGVLPAADIIYVNAGATHPLDVWLDALAVGGRLILPLTTSQWFGWVLLITREAGGYSARAVSWIRIVPCAGARDDASSQRLAAALGSPSILKVRSLHRNSTPDDTAWLSGPGWWLSTAAVG